jgi:hypothetical protein
MESRLLRRQAREATGIVEHTLVVEGLAGLHTTTGGVLDSTAVRGIPGARCRWRGLREEEGRPGSMRPRTLIGMSKVEVVAFEVDLEDGLRAQLT